MLARSSSTAKTASHKGWCAAEAKIDLAEKESTLAQLQQTVKDTEAHAEQRTREAMDHTKGIQWSSEEALRRQREDFERIRLGLEHALEQKEDELQRMSSQAEGAVEDVLRGRDAADDLLREECRAAAAAARSATLRQEVAERQAAEVRGRLAVSRGGACT